MQIRKIVAILIQIVVIAVWVYFIIVTLSYEVSLARFILFVLLVPLALASFYATLKLWKGRTSKPKKEIKLEETKVHT